MKIPKFDVDPIFRFLGRGFLIFKFHKNEAKHDKSKFKRSLTVTLAIRSSKLLKANK